VQSKRQLVATIISGCITHFIWINGKIREKGFLKVLKQWRSDGTLPQEANIFLRSAQQNYSVRSENLRRNAEETKAEHLLLLFLFFFDNN